MHTVINAYPQRENSNKMANGGIDPLEVVLCLYLHADFFCQLNLTPVLHGSEDN